MDSEVFQKIVPIVAPLIIGAATIYVAIRQFSLGSKNSYREEYKFAKAFFEDIEQNPKMHKYAKHKGYQAILGTQSIPSEVIEYIMHVSDPVRAIEDYAISRSHLKYIKNDKEFRLQFDSKFLFATAQRRRFWLSLFFVSFCLCYVFAFSPWFAWIFKVIDLNTMLTLSALTFPVGLGGIVFFVREFVKLSRAMRLLKQVEEDGQSSDLTEILLEDHD